MKPRFKPTQKVWMPWEDRALCVDVMEVVYTEFNVRYEIQTVNELGQQSFEIYFDMPGSECLLFETEKECEKWMKK